MIACLLAGFVLLPYLDRVDNEKYKVCAEDKADEDDSPECVIDENVLLDAIPESFSSPYSFVRFMKELPQQHRWLSPIFHYSDTVPRAYRLLSMWNQVIAQLFFTAVFFNMNR